jgi:hypothetical protein
MTVIGTGVLAVDSLRALSHAIVRIGFPRYRGSFPTLKFGEKKPVTGFIQNGQLDLVYPEDPLLRAGQAISALGDSVNHRSCSCPE